MRPRPGNYNNDTYLCCQTALLFQFGHFANEIKKLWHDQNKSALTNLKIFNIRKKNYFLLKTSWQLNQKHWFANKNFNCFVISVLHLLLVQWICFPWKSGKFREAGQGKSAKSMINQWFSSCDRAWSAFSLKLYDLYFIE